MGRECSRERDAAQPLSPREVAAAGRGVASRADDVLAPEICVLRYALERHAATKTDAVYAVFDGGERWT